MRLISTQKLTDFLHRGLNTILTKVLYEDGTLRNETKRNGTLRNGTLRNGTLRNGTLRNGTLRNGTLRNGYTTQRFITPYLEYLEFH